MPSNKSSITVEADSNGYARLRIRHILESDADQWEHAGDYSLLLSPEDRAALISALRGVG